MEESDGREAIDRNHPEGLRLRIIDPEGNSQNFARHLRNLGSLENHEAQAVAVYEDGLAHFLHPGGHPRIHLGDVGPGNGEAASRLAEGALVTMKRQHKLPLPWLLTPEEWERFARNPEAFRGSVTHYLQDTVIPEKVYSLEEMRAWCRASRKERARVAR